MADVGFWEPPAPQPPSTAGLLSLFDRIGRDLVLGLALFLPVPLKRRTSGDVRVILAALLILFGLAFVVDYVDAGSWSGVPTLGTVRTLRHAFREGLSWF